MSALAKWEQAEPQQSAALAVALETTVYLKKTVAGSPTYLVNGNMFAGVQGNKIFLRLGKADRDYLLSCYANSTLLEPVIGRPEKEYVTAPTELFQDMEAMRCWVKRSFDYTAALPPKIGSSIKTPGRAIARKKTRPSSP